MRIDRSSLVDELERFARSGSGLLTGAPGVGKTYSVRELHERWKANGFPHLLVPIEQLGTATDAEILSVLGAGKDLVTLVAEAFTDPQTKGVVVLDGFDSARSEATRERVLQLIRRLLAEASNRWTVLVTVRLYDASRSEALRALFRDRSAPSPRVGRGLDETRRFEIPLLNEAEVDTAIDQISGLRELAEKSTSDFRDLLRVPFNLWLLSQILTTPGPQRQISQISSEVQLLALYWKRRVLASHNLEGVRHLLERAVGKMVAANSLSVRRDQLYEPTVDSTWAEAFSSGVLISVGTAQQRVAFAHNILFDYAVSVLLLDDEPRAMHNFIAADAARPFFLRPSITFYFTRLWYDSRPNFWASTWATLSSASSNVRLVGRIVPPAVIVSEARSSEDLSALLQAIDGREPNAKELLLRVFQALRAHEYSSTLVWANLAADAVERPDPLYLWNTVTFAADLLESAGSADLDEVRQVVGRLGRQALRWALDEREKNDNRFADAVGGLWAIKLVAETFDTDKGASALLIRRVLSLLDQPRFPIEYISRLSDEISSIAPYDGELVAEIYVAVFAHAEESEDVTSFGTPILPLRSTRRQDFEMCEYSLVKEFDTFLTSAPSQAVRAALECVNSYAISQHLVPFLREGKTVADLTDEFSFRGRRAKIVNDYSSIWGGSGHQDDAMQLLHKVIAGLESAITSEQHDVVDLILDEFAAQAEVAIEWGALLSLGIKHPRELGPKLAPLAVAPGVQRSIEHTLVNFVEKTAAHWSVRDRSRLEESIVEGLTATQRGHEKSTPRVANLLLLALPSETLKNSELRAKRTALETAPERPISNPPPRIQVWSEKYDTEDWLEDEGVDTSEPPNRALLDTEKKLDELDLQFRNKRPSSSDVAQIVTALKSAIEVVASEEENAADRVVDLAETKIAAAAHAIARAEGEIQESDLALARRVLLEAAAVLPASHDQEEQEEHTFPSWSPSSQTEAAQGLPWLVLRGANGEVLNAIHALTTKGERSVRYLSALELFRIRWKASERFWAIATESAKNETSRLVMSGLFRSLARMPREDGGRIVEVLKILQERNITPTDERSDFTEGYTHLLVWLALNLQEPWAMQRLDAIATLPLTFEKLTQRVVFQVLTVITADYISDQDVRPISLRAIAWLKSLLEAVTAASPVLKTASSEPSKAELLFGIVDDVAARLYFHARPNNQLEGPADPRSLKGYYEAVKPIVLQVVEFGRSVDSALLARTAHHLMELLHLCLSVDPAGVLHMAADVAQASERGGYNLDSMAVREVVAIADALLTGHREKLQSGQSLDDFVRLLDVFASAGWPDALRVIWQLDEVFR